MLNFLEFLERMSCQARGHPDRDVIVTDTGWLIEMCQPCSSMNVFVDEDIDHDEVVAYLMKHFLEFVGASISDEE